MYWLKDINHALFNNKNIHKPIKLEGIIATSINGGSPCIVYRKIWSGREQTAIWDQQVPRVRLTYPATKPSR